MAQIRARITGGFWDEQLQLLHETTVYSVYERFVETHRFDALAGRWTEDSDWRPHIFWDSDIYKWLEGAILLQARRPAERLAALIEETITSIEAAQQPSGYINSYFVHVEPEARFTRRVDHELYCLGHLIEAAVTLAEALEDQRLIAVVDRAIDEVDRIFREEKSAAFVTPGHQEIELALLRLYGLLGRARDLELARFFIDRRGANEADGTYDFADMEHLQSHLPVREQHSAEGHAVRAFYQYTAMAELARLTDDAELRSAVEALYEDATRRKMYVTGAFGSTEKGESFSIPYNLPNERAYAETCASIAFAQFARSMWALDARADYVDAIERALYNTILGAISLEGDAFYYENPLRVDRAHYEWNASRPPGLRRYLPTMLRSRVFSCSCCPPNLLRFIGALDRYLFAVRDARLYIQSYATSEAELSLDGQAVRVRVETDYPRGGAVRIEVEATEPVPLALRIPEGTRLTSLRFADSRQSLEPEDGYVYLVAQGTIELELALETRWLRADPRVHSALGGVALTRGPIVYCLESSDDEAISRYVVRERETTPERIEIAGRPIDCLRAALVQPAATTALYEAGEGEGEARSVRFIPFYARLNRGPADVEVWLPAD